MMKYFNRITLFFMLTLLPPTIFGIYPSGKASNQDQPITSRLVVRLKTEASPVLNIDKKGAVTTGLASFDALNAKNEIAKLRFLYPEERFSYLSTNLKNTFIIELPNGENIARIAEEYDALDEVAYAHPDWQAELHGVPDDPLYSYQWSLNNTGQDYFVLSDSIDQGYPDADIDAQEVFVNPPDNTQTVIVAIIDTGVDTDHPELAGRIWSNPGEIPDNGFDDDHNGYIDDKYGWDFCGNSWFSEPDNDPTDFYGHGTHCAGIVTAVTDNAAGIAGISPHCKIMALKFSPVPLASYASQAIIYAADNGADVISMSWGYHWPVEVINDALAYARAKGVVLVASVGNDGMEQYNFPASYPGVITVGATNADDLITIFSTYSSKLNISAPGRYILSLRADNTDMYDDGGKHIILGYYYIASGTSMSGPHVAGAAAYLRSISPGLSPDATENILQMNADDIVDPFDDGSNYPGWDIYSGWGRLNLYQAINNAPALGALISSPQTNQIISGTVNVVGLADGDDFTRYVLEYGQGAVPSSWTEIITSSTPVTDGLLSSWNTAGLNGRYTLRLRVGETNISYVSVFLANDINAVFDSPRINDTVTSWTNIYGSAVCPGFNRYSLEYGAGLTPGSWSVIDESTVPVDNGKLAYWDVNSLADGWYTLSLSVYSDAGLEDSTAMPVYIQSIFSTENAWKLNFSDYVAIVPNYGDFDNDGSNEIVVGTESGIYFINPDGTMKISGIPALPESENYRVPPAVGDLDGDGHDDLVVCTSSKIHGILSSLPDFEINLPTTPLYSQYSSTDANYPSLYLKDLDGNKKDEIFYYPGYNSNSIYTYIYNSDGSFRSNIINGDCSPLAADLNSDGLDEIYICYADEIRQYNETGVLIKNVIHDRPGFRTKYLSAVDIDNDDTLELIAFGKYSNAEKHFIYAYDSELNDINGWSRNTGIDGYLTPLMPVFGDIDRDGNLEYFISFYELAYSQTFAWRIDGSALLGDSITPIFAVTENPSIITTPLIADLNDDGFLEIIANAQKDIFYTYKVRRTIAWDKNGELLEGWPLILETDDLPSCNNMSWYVPVIGDINGDGFIDLMTTTSCGHLVFFNLEGNYYDPHNCPVPFWRYNRRMNMNAVFYEQTDCCIGFTGNVNCSDLEAPDISDVTRLIDFLYISRRPLCCREEADCDGSGGDPDISDIIRIIDYLYISRAPLIDCP